MKIKRYKKGFGLLEVAIAGTIITIIMSSLVVLGRSSLTSAEAATERSTATYLAQEAIEQVRQMRDTNWIDGSADTAWNSLCWDATMSPHTQQCSVTNGAKAYSIAYYPSGSSTVVDRYFLQSGPATPEDHGGIPYKTEVKLLKPETPVSHLRTILPAQEPLYPETDVDRQNNGIIVEVAVTWPGQGGAGTRNVTVRELLTNWRPNI